MNKLAYRLLGLTSIAGLAYAATTMEQRTRITITVIVGLMSFALMVISRRQLGKAFAVMPEAKALVTTGLYSKIQHPMYVFLDLFLVCVVVAIDSPILMLVVPIVVALQMIQAHREEKVLLAAFGSRYTAYESGVWV